MGHLLVTQPDELYATAGPSTVLRHPAGEDFRDPVRDDLLETLRDVLCSGVHEDALTRVRRIHESARVTFSTAQHATRALCLALRVGLAAIPAVASAHGVAGQRFFPTTFAVDDPFMNDEFSVLLHSVEMKADAPRSRIRTTSVGVGYSKTILPGFGLQLDEEYLWLHSPGDPTASGVGNLGVTLKYQFLTSDSHETILSVGLSDEIGGTGSASVGAESFSTISPMLFFGKGLGDLPESLGVLRPLAVAGVVGPSFPTQRTRGGVVNPTTLNWGFTVQYSLMYLQSAVKDIGLGSPLNRLIALVEIPLRTCLNAACVGPTTWTVNPGIVWIGKYMEVGAAAEIPVNTQPGSDIGVFVLVHLFIDDLFPGSIGRPILQ